jgi:hypothetical protein
MALNNEDKKDVAKHMGKALANKVHKATIDKKYGATFGDIHKAFSNKDFKKTGTWVDKVDRSKHSPSTLKRWASDAKRAKKDYKPATSYPQGSSNIS